MLQEVEKEISRRKADAEERIRQHRIKKEEQFQRNWHELTASEGRQLHEEWGRKLDLHDREKQLKAEKGKGTDACRGDPSRKKRRNAHL